MTGFVEPVFVPNDPNTQSNWSEYWQDWSPVLAQVTRRLTRHDQALSVNSGDSDGSASLRIHSCYRQGGHLLLAVQCSDKLLFLRRDQKPHCRIEVLWERKLASASTLISFATIYGVGPDASFRLMYSDGPCATQQLIHKVLISSNGTIKETLLQRSACGELVQDPKEGLPPFVYSSACDRSSFLLAQSVGAPLTAYDNESLCALYEIDCLYDSFKRPIVACSQRWIAFATDTIPTFCTRASLRSRDENASPVGSHESLVHKFSQIMSREMAQGAMELHIRGRQALEKYLNDSKAPVQRNDETSNADATTDSQFRFGGRYVVIYDIKKQNYIGFFDADCQVGHISFGPSGTTLLVARATGDKCFLFDLRNLPACVRPMQKISRGLSYAFIHRVAWSHGESQVAVITTNHTVHLFDTRTGQAICRFKGTSVGFDIDSQLILPALGNSTLRSTRPNESSSRSDTRTTEWDLSKIQWQSHTKDERAAKHASPPNYAAQAETNTCSERPLLVLQRGIELYTFRSTRPTRRLPGGTTGALGRVKVDKARGEVVPNSKATNGDDPIAAALAESLLRTKNEPTESIPIKFRSSRAADSKHWYGASVSVGLDRLQIPEEMYERACRFLKHSAGISPRQVDYLQSLVQRPHKSSGDDRHSYNLSFDDEETEFVDLHKEISESSRDEIPSSSNTSPESHNAMPVRDEDHVAWLHDKPSF